MRLVEFKSWNAEKPIFVNPNKVFAILGGGTRNNDPVTYIDSGGAEDSGVTVCGDARDVAIALGFNVPAKEESK